MGIIALLSFLPTAEQGREGWLAGGGPGRRLRVRGRLWSEGKERGRREDPIPGRGSVGGGSWELGHDGRRATAGGDCGGASARFGGGQGVGQKHEGTLGARFPRSPWVGMERGDGAMAACGGG